MAKIKHRVNPTFRLDVDGRLFKERADNPDIQDTLIFNDLYTKLNITKGDLPLFPYIGLKQFLYLFGFNDEEDVKMNVSSFENAIEEQMGRDCVIDYKLDKDNKSVELNIGLEGLKYPISFKYFQLQNSIKVIHYEFDK